MSFYAHPGSYDSVSAKHTELMAEAELARMIDAAGQERHGIADRLKLALGQMLIVVGERLSRRAAAASRP